MQNLEDEPRSSSINSTLFNGIECANLIEQKKLPSLDFKPIQPDESGLQRKQGSFSLVPHNRILLGQVDCEAASIL